MGMEGNDDRFSVGARGFGLKLPDDLLVPEVHTIECSDRHYRVSKFREMFNVCVDPHKKSRR
jgi:hypothetical protein